MAKHALPPAITQEAKMWYVLWVMTGREEEIINAVHNKVPEELYRKAWTPYRLKIMKYHGEEQRNLIRMFPGYVFIDTEEPEKTSILDAKELFNASAP